jgi:hypothetical protein
MRLCLLFILLTFAAVCQAQPAITVASGFSINAYKKKGSTANFNHVPLSVQWSPFGFKNVLLVKFDYFIPFSNSAIDPAYTLNPNLPPEIKVKKSLRAHMFDLNVGARLPIHRYKGKYNFYTDVLLTAVSHQNIKVSYADYDQSNYEILNPDLSLRKTSISLSTGFVYKYSLENNSNLLCMLHFQFIPFVSTTVHGYDLSYTFVSPIQLTIGYSFSYKNNKHSK